MDTEDLNEFLALESQANARAAAAAAAESESSARKNDLEADALAMNIEWTRRRHDEEMTASYYHGVFEFNGAVANSSVNAFVKVLGEFSRGHAGEEITIIFNSPGGDVIAGLALFDYIRDLRERGHRVITKTIGMAASMGGILLQAGEERVAGPNSYMLIHEVSSGAIGKASEMEDELKFTKRLQEDLLSILAERSTLTVTQIKNRWLKKDWWLDAEEMLKLGFIDRIG